MLLLGDASTCWCCLAVGEARAADDCTFLVCDDDAMPCHESVLPTLSSHSLIAVDEITAILSQCTLLCLRLLRCSIPTVRLASTAFLYVYQLPTSCLFWWKNRLSPHPPGPQDRARTSRGGVRRGTQRRGRERAGGGRRLRAFDAVHARVRRGRACRRSGPGRGEEVQREST